MSLSVFKPLSQQSRILLCDDIGLSCDVEDGLSFTEEKPLNPPVVTRDVTPDGNCLFRALSCAVCGNQEMYAYFRRIVVSYLSFDSVGKTIQPYEDYVSQMSMNQNHVWGTDIEILAAASLLKVNILVYTLYGDKRDWVIFSPIRGKTKVEGAIYLNHKNENHYDVVTSVSTSKHNLKSSNIYDEGKENEAQSLDHLSVDDSKEDFTTPHFQTNNTASRGEVNDIFDFSEMEFHSPLRSSTPKKPKKLKKTGRNEEENNGTYSGILSSEEGDKTLADTSLHHKSFEDMLEARHLPCSKKKRNDKLLQKAIINSQYLESSICNNKCIRQFNQQVLQRINTKFWNKNYQHRVEWFIDKVVETVNFGKNVSAAKASFLLEGNRRVCGKCFRSILNMDKNFFYKFFKKAKEGASSSGIRKARMATEVKNEAEEWLSQYVHFHADRMPDKNDLMLPYKTRKIDIYHLYSSETTERFKPIVGKSTFYEIWSSWKNLKIKQTNSFSKCGTCVHLEREMQDTRDPIEREMIKQKVAVHNERQKNERSYYYEKRERAIRQPRKYLSLITDGMDQSKTNLPHFTGRPLKGIDPNSLLRTHIQGVLNHGCGVFRTFVDLNEYQHDSNLVMNTLLTCIHESKVKLGMLPEILYIQADNCARENKNRFVFAFCHVLVELNVFREVHVSFLPVGHTHEDIDAKFSKIADMFRRNDVETLPKMLHHLPNASQTRGLMDIRGWLLPRINLMFDHSKVLHFKFTADYDSTVKLSYKTSCQQEWNIEETPVLDSVPTSPPAVLIPKYFDKIDTTALQNNILKYKYILSDAHFWWWQAFITSMVVTKSSEKEQYEYAEYLAE